MLPVALIGAGISAAGSVAGSLINHGAVGQAQNAQTLAGQQAIAEQQKALDRYLKLVQPYVGAGGGAVNEMTSLLGLDQPGRSTIGDASSQLQEGLLKADAKRGAVQSDYLDRFRSEFEKRLREQKGFSEAGAREFVSPVIDQTRDRLDLANEKRQEVVGDYRDRFLNRFQNAAEEKIGPDTPFISGRDRQEAAIAATEESPLFQHLIKQGEDAILQNASATGGLRGGNTQKALMQFRPSLLNSLINQRLGQLGGLYSGGLNAATGAGVAGLNTGQGIASSLFGIGEAQAQGALGRANAINQGIGGVSNALGQIVGRYSGIGNAPKMQAPDQNRGF